MSRDTRVIVNAEFAETVMAPLTVPDPERAWRRPLHPVTVPQFRGGYLAAGDAAEDFCNTWIGEFNHLDCASFLADLESLRWPCPHSVQVLIQGEEDNCFGLWMMYDGRLQPIELPRPERRSVDHDPDGILYRTDCPQDDCGGLA